MLGPGFVSRTQRELSGDVIHDWPGAQGHLRSLQFLLLLLFHGFQWQMADFNTMPVSQPTHFYLTDPHTPELIPYPGPLL